MCGIVGYTGKNPAKDILFRNLQKLEYRGYDSAGIALQTADGLQVVRRLGKVANLVQASADTDPTSTCGIAHTRWATHGRPSEANAHPHRSCDNKVAVCHNGIVENYAELRERLVAEGHTFRSETDTEVVAHLVEKYYRGDLLSAARAAVREMIGAFGLVIMHADEPGTIVVARKDSPIVIGQGEDGCYVASDVIAVAEATRDVVVLEDYQFAKLTPEGMSFCNGDGQTIEPEHMRVDWEIDETERGNWPDFMLKEIHEQPRVVRDTLKGRMVNGLLSIDELELTPDELGFIDRVYVIACGTSYHAGLIAKDLIENWARIPTEVEVASEFRYRNPIITPSTLVVAVSQSGETADTLAAIRDARIRGAKVFGITNVIGSRIARESDGVIYTKAKKEVAVASTKSFIGQVVSLTLLAMLLAQSKNRLNTAQIRVLFRELADTAGQIEEILSDTKAIEAAAHDCADAQSALYIGRGLASTVCYEGALKLKEISYVHAEAYAAGEMKHGPIALLHEGFPVVAVATQSPIYDKTLSNIEESKARGAKIVAVATEGDDQIGKYADHVLFIPKVRDAFMPITASVVLQLFARAIAVERGCDVDQPRNLAKSVTVE
ncbi:MAG: glutamine--fructose-6-phosphate transaminase (isomerizing) [Coriobacteriaceae bacterium]|nr:glutamine--fructose-6-phosphate transaminase (isomerizing) [Coriobacteriaceae bacterium]